jgi:hypothetical protein
MFMRKGDPGYSVSPKRTLFGESGTEVRIAPLLDGVRTLTGEKIQWYLAAELRDRIRQTGVEAQSPKIRSRRCCETMIFVPSSFIRLSEPISRGSVIGQRTSRTRLRASCPTSRTSEHSRAGARRCDVRMFGCLSLDGPHREGCLLAGLRTHLPLERIPVI